MIVTLTLARCFSSLFFSLYTYTYTYTYCYYYCILYFLVLTKPAPAWVPVKVSFSTSDTIVTLYRHRSTNRFVSLAISPSLGGVPGLPIGDWAGSSNNLVPRGTKLSAIDMTAKTIFECMYLILGLRQFAPWVNCPYAPTPPPLTQQLFLDFCAIFFPSGPSFFCQHTIYQVIWPSPGTLHPLTHTQTHTHCLSHTYTHRLSRQSKDRPLFEL